MTMTTQSLALGVSAPRVSSSQQETYLPVTSTMNSTANLETTASSYEQSRRQISSVVIAEEFLGPMPPETTVTYVEVPVVEEVIRHVPKLTVVEIEKIVPKYEVEYVERVVEVPQIQYIDRAIEKPQVTEVVREVPGPKQIQEIPREVVRAVPKIEYKQVEKVVEVPGEVIEVPTTQIVQRHVEVPRLNDKEVPVIVAQTIRPVITEAPEPVDVDIYEYEPQVIPVDVLVAKPVASQLIAMGATAEEHRQVSVPAAQYNSILRSLNAHLNPDDLNELPYVQDTTGTTPFLQPHETPAVIQPAMEVAPRQLPSHHMSTAAMSQQQQTQPQTLPYSTYPPTMTSSQQQAPVQPRMVFAGNPQVAQRTVSSQLAGYQVPATPQQYPASVVAPSIAGMRHLTGEVAMTASVKSQQRKSTKQSHHHHHHHKSSPTKKRGGCAC